MQRYTFMFENGPQGWSETLYRTEPFASFEQILLDNYTNRRLEALATTCRLVGIRSSNTDSARDILVYPVPLGGRGGAWAYGGDPGGGIPGLATETEDSFTALLLRLTDGARHYRSWPMLGIPDHVFQGGIIVPAEQPLVNSRLNNWIASIQQAGFGMKGQGAPAKTGRIIEFPAKTEDNQLVCLGLKGTLPVVGEHVTLASVKPFNKLNRTFRVSGTSAGIGAVDGYIYLAGTASLNTFGPVEGGTYKVPTFTSYILSSYTISRLTSRRTGVPFSTVRGRR